MKFAAVLNTFAPDCDAQMGRILGFIRNTGLDPQDGILVLCSRLNTGFQAVIPGGKALFSKTINVSGNLCMPRSVAEFIQNNIHGIDMYIMPGNIFGNELAVHIGSRLDGSSVCGITSAAAVSDSGSEKLVVRRNIYANHVAGTFEMNRKPFCISLDSSLSSDPVRLEQYAAGPDAVMHEEDFCRELRTEPREIAADLDRAECIVIGGNGLRCRKNAEEMTGLAESAGMIAAGSRPCVMNAWLPMNRMIGVSGSIISPKIAILLGISGAPAFYEGVKGSRKIIAVNKDPEAPIGRKSDLLITGDCMVIFRAFAEKYAGERIAKIQTEK